MTATLIPETMPGPNRMQNLKTRLPDCSILTIPTTKTPPPLLPRRRRGRKRLPPRSFLRNRRKRARSASGAGRREQTMTRTTMKLRDGSCPSGRGWRLYGPRSVTWSAVPGPKLKPLSSLAIAAMRRARRRSSPVTMATIQGIRTRQTPSSGPRRMTTSSTTRGRIPTLFASFMPNSTLTMNVERAPTLRTSALGRRVGRSAGGRRDPMRSVMMIWTVRKCPIIPSWRPCTG
mmetsp:Transcript_7484/g.16380  ORF Transcript_7484/g.16380 Transcript_7484/m.16380 type:complete len:232 (+) Transcript_7484:262-957(+)